MAKLAHPGNQEKRKLSQPAVHFVKCKNSSGLCGMLKLADYF